MKALMILMLSLAVSVLSGGAASAAPGDLDSSFSGDGRVVNRYEEVGLAVQSDGKPLYLSTNFTVLRYTKSGTLDSTFAGDGSAFANFRQLGQESTAISVQPDGKILLAGQVATTQGTRTGLARLRKDGTLDTTFSGDGLAIKGGSITVRPRNIAIDPNGRILVGGEKYVMAFNANGSVSTNFGTKGIALVNPPGSDTEVSAVGVQPSGRIIFAGDTMTFCEPEGECEFGIFVGRLTPSGQLDTTFGSGGYRIVKIDFYMFLGSMAVHPTTGEVTLAGQGCSGPDHNECSHAVARLTAGGNLEAEGWVELSVYVVSSLSGVALQGNKTVVAGEWNEGDYDMWSVERLNENLTMDANFGSSEEPGVAYADFGAEHAGARHVAVWRNRIYASGYTGLDEQVGGLVAYQGG